MLSSFKDFDLTDFWEESEYALVNFVSLPPTDELINSIERELNYKLPSSYVELMKNQNGGIPHNSLFLTKEKTSRGRIVVAVSEIMGIGRDKKYSLCGEFGSKFMIDEWGYPDIGIYFGNCPSAGHDMICFDYRETGKNGEPQVAYVNQEDDYKIIVLAGSFEEFIKSLTNEHAFDK